MFAIITPTDDTLFKVLGDFIEGLIDCKAVQGFVNRAAMPIGGFITMATLRQIRLSTNTTFYNDTFVEQGVSFGGEEVVFDGQPITFAEQDVFFGGEEVVFDGQNIAFGGTPNGTKAVTQAIEWTVQLDCYGVQSMQWANILTTLFRDEFSCSALKPYIQPLGADDPISLPLINGEQQYEQRWVVEAKFQYNSITTVPQQFFDRAVVERIHSAD